MPTNGSIGLTAPERSVSITVCVPVYNVERYLRECLDSIFSQDYPHFDVVMVDDGSTDGSGAVCDEYAEMLRWLDASDMDAGRKEVLTHAALRAKYDSYMWNYVRIAPELRAPFLERMASEYRESISAGAFSLEDLAPWKRVNLREIMRDPEGFVDVHASYADAGRLGRAWHYLRLGGPGVLAAYLRSRR